MIDHRENPRRDVIHYESPPRRRLREQEDEVIKTYHLGKLGVRPRSRFSAFVGLLAFGFFLLDFC